MELSDLWLKMARNESLTPQELDYLRIQGKNTQQNNAQAAGNVNADGKMQLINPYIDSPIWKNALNSTTFDLSESSVSSGVDTQLAVNQVQLRSTSYSFTLGTTGAKIKIATQNNFFVCGWVDFQSNSTGYRKVAIGTFDAVGSSALYDMAILSAVNGEGTIVPFSYMFDRKRNDTYNSFATSEIGLYVLQNSGSTLNVLAQLCIMEA